MPSNAPPILQPVSSFSLGPGSLATFEASGSRRELTGGSSAINNRMSGFAQVASPHHQSTPVMGPTAGASSGGFSGTGPTAVGGAADTSTTPLNSSSSIGPTSRRLRTDEALSVMLRRVRNAAAFPLRFYWGVLEAQGARLPRHIVAAAPAAAPWQPPGNFGTADAVAVASEPSSAQHYCVAGAFAKACWDDSDLAGTPDGDRGGGAGGGGGGVPFGGNARGNCGLGPSADLFDNSRIFCWRQARSMAETAAKAAERLSDEMIRAIEGIAATTISIRCLAQVTEGDLRETLRQLRREADGAAPSTSSPAKGTSGGGSGGKVVLHYIGHGLPPPSNNAVFVYNSKGNVVGLAVEEICHAAGFPCILVVDGPSAGTVLKAAMDAFQRDVEAQHGSGPRSFLRGRIPAPSQSVLALDEMGASSVSTPVTASASTFPFRLSAGHQSAADVRGRRDFFFFGSCSPGEELPTHPLLPSDLLTSCITSPVTVAILWYVAQHREYADIHPAIAHILPNGPKGRNDKDAPFQRLTKVFQSITDCLAWAVLSPPDFNRLMRQDHVLAPIVRGFLLADRILSALGVCPVSHPPIPSEHQTHPLWSSLDDAVGSIVLPLIKAARLPPSRGLAPCEQRSFLDVRIARDRHALGFTMAIPEPTQPHLSRPPASMRATGGVDSTGGGTAIQQPRLHNNRSGGGAALIAGTGSSGGSSAVVTLPPLPTFVMELLGLHALADSMALAEMDDGGSKGPHIERLPMIFHAFLNASYRHDALHALARLIDHGPWAVVQCAHMQLFAQGPNRLVARDAKSLCNATEPMDLMLRELLVFIYVKALAADASIACTHRSLAALFQGILQQDLPRTTKQQQQQHSPLTSAGESGILGHYSGPMGQRLLAASGLLIMCQHGTWLQPVLLEGELSFHLARLLPTCSAALEALPDASVSENAVLTQLMQVNCVLLLVLLSGREVPDTEIMHTYSAIVPLLSDAASSVRFCAWYVALGLVSIAFHADLPRIVTSLGLFACRSLVEEGSADVRVIIVAVLFATIEHLRDDAAQLTAEECRQALEPLTEAAPTQLSAARQFFHSASLGSAGFHRQSLDTFDLGGTSLIMDMGETPQSPIHFLGSPQAAGSPTIGTAAGPPILQPILQAPHVPSSTAASRRRISTSVDADFGSMLPSPIASTSGTGFPKTPPQSTTQEHPLVAPKPAVQSAIFSLAVAATSPCPVTRGHALKALQKLSAMIPQLPNPVAERARRLATHQNGLFSASVTARKDNNSRPFFSFLAGSRRLLSGDVGERGASVTADMSGDAMRADLEDITLPTYDATDPHAGNAIAAVVLGFLGKPLLIPNDAYSPEHPSMVALEGRLDDSDLTTFEALDKTAASLGVIRPDARVLRRPHVLDTQRAVAHVLTFAPHSNLLVLATREGGIQVHEPDRTAHAALPATQQYSTPYQLRCHFSLAGLSGPSSPYWAGTSEAGGSPHLMTPSSSIAVRHGAQLNSVNIQNLQQLSRRTGPFGGGAAFDVSTMHVIDPLIQPTLVCVSGKGAVSVVERFHEPGAARRAAAFSLFSYEDAHAMHACPTAVCPQKHLLIGGGKRAVCMWDLASEHMADAWTMPGDAEKIVAHPGNPNVFAAGGTNGSILIFDSRVPQRHVLRDNYIATLGRSQGAAPGAGGGVAGGAGGGRALGGDLHLSRIVDMSFSLMAEALLATLTGGGDVYLWDMRAAVCPTGDRMTVTPQPETSRRHAAVTPRGKPDVREPVTVGMVHPCFYDRCAVLWGNGQRQCVTFGADIRRISKDKPAVAMAWHPLLPIAAIADVGRTSIIEVAPNTADVQRLEDIMKNF